MDYVPAHGDKNNLADREFVSGARVFDGEDQGKYPSLSRARSKLIKICLHEMLTPGLGYGNRFRMQQLQQEDWIK